MNYTNYDSSAGTIQPHSVTIPNFNIQTQGNNDMLMSYSITKLMPSLLKAQSAMGNAVKGANNPFFKSRFADLNSVREASHPSLNENGITVLQPMIQKDGKTYVRTLLVHESGEYLGSETEVVVKANGNAQDYGSGISYARRYGLQSLLSLGTADDDGEAAVGRAKPEQKQWAASANPTTLTAEQPAVQVSSNAKSTFKKPTSSKKLDAPSSAQTSDDGNEWQ